MDLKKGGCRDVYPWGRVVEEFEDLGSTVNLKLLEIVVFGGLKDNFCRNCPVQSVYLAR